MQNLKKKTSIGSSNADSDEAPKQKERHIVSWSQEEDDILREQIRIHGTENWTIIASKFKDKTTRQCRRRWFTYLNSDFKKGGWSPEEDMLLCEAQKIFGNRWTEIAKVVSGRTDNAVKNRFSTLCKKKAKHEALAKENNTSYINLNNKRVIFPTGPDTSGIPEIMAPLKKMRRTQTPEDTANCNLGEKLLGECAMATNQLLRPPFAVIAQNFHKVEEDFPVKHDSNIMNEGSTDACKIKNHGTFLKKDDPKIFALMQQAELLSSLALKVNAETTDQSLENAWKVLQEFLNQTKEGDQVKLKICDIDVELEDFKDLLEELRSNNEDGLPSWRQPALSEDSAASSEYSTGSTLLQQTTNHVKEQSPTDLCASHIDVNPGLQSTQLDNQIGYRDSEKGTSDAATTDQDILPPCDQIKSSDGEVSEYANPEFSSPVQVTPLFRSLAAAIPSPKFSESERQFLLKTLGMESASANPGTNPSQPPSCKRVLLQSL